MGLLVNLLLSKFKSVVIVGSSAVGASAIVAPVALAGNRYEEYLFREFNPKEDNLEHLVSSTTQASSSSTTNGNVTEDPSVFSNFPQVRVSNAQLIKGTKSYNNGNYVLYFGSEACPNCNNFLYNEAESPKSWQGKNKNIYKNGILFETYSLIKAHAKKDTNTKLKNIKFIFFSDEIPSMDERNNDDLARIPWTTWPKTLVSQGFIKDDFVRYDKSAVEFRKLQSLLLYYFGEKASGIPTVIIYKDGMPFVYGKDKIDELEEDKKNAGSSVNVQEATAAIEDVALRFDLFRYVNYIYNSTLIWIK